MAFRPPPRLAGETPTALVDLAKHFIYMSKWTYAITMPRNPHWYVVRPRLPHVSAGHEALFELIRDYHEMRRWFGQTYRAVSLDGWDYWIIEDGTIINRKPTMYAGWTGTPRPPTDWCPDEWRRDIGGWEHLLPGEIA